MSNLLQRKSPEPKEMKDNKIFGDDSVVPTTRIHLSKLDPAVQKKGTSLVNSIRKAQRAKQAGRQVKINSISIGEAIS